MFRPEGARGSSMNPAPYKYNCTDFRVVSTLDLAPLQLQGASVWVEVPRVETWLKPWAEFLKPLRGIAHRPHRALNTCGRLAY
jgi:hypothetical protein